jgi:hypothetical protein
MSASAGEPSFLWQRRRRAELNAASNCRYARQPPLSGKSIPGGFGAIMMKWLAKFGKTRPRIKHPLVPGAYCASGRPHIPKKPRGVEIGGLRTGSDGPPRRSLGARAIGVNAE